MADMNSTPPVNKPAETGQQKKREGRAGVLRWVRVVVKSCWCCCLVQVLAGNEGQKVQGIKELAT
jgi:hypothetical protein